MPESPVEPLTPSAVLRLIPAVVAAALLLGACGGQPLRPPPETAPAKGDAAPPVAAADKAPAPARPGGYYLDDGPGDNAPPDLDAIPDAEPKVEPLHRYANSPYSVFGEDYVPTPRLGPYKKSGMASWYGRRFHGRKTASGEPYDMYAMTAAHPTLPIPSYAQVTNVANGKAVVVRINDRGPFHPGRIIDLSYTAAHRLGYVQKGATKVEVRSILPEDIRLAARAAKSAAAGRRPAELARAGDKPAARTPPKAVPPALTATASIASSRPLAAADDDPLAEFLASEEVQATPAPLPTVLDLRGIFLQLGVFSSRDNAESFRDHLRSELSWLGQNLHVQSKDGRYRLHLGPYAGAQEAKRVADRIRDAMGVKSLLVER